MQALRPLVYLAADIALWLCVPAAFLFLYCARYTAPTDAVLPHLGVIGIPLAAFALTRITLAALATPLPVRRLLTAGVAWALFTAMVSYYVLVAIGLEYWGRVISWDLFASYARSAAELADSLGVSLHLAGGAFALIGFAIFAAGWWYAKRFDWAPAVAREIPVRVLWVGIPAGFMIVAIGVYEFLASPPTRRFEPVSLTFFPREGAWDLQGHAIDPLSAARLDRQEDAERAAYGPAPGAARRNVVLIVVDALRPDHMGVYGYARDTTPHLDRLDRAGMVRKAGAVHAVCASSSCGLVGLASSKYVHQFHTRPITLQEVLKRHGYRIHFILSGDHSSFYGLKLAYGEADSYLDGSTARGIMNADRVVIDGLARFPEWDGVPAMFQFHLMSAHALGKRDPASQRFQPASTYLRPEGRGRDGAQRGINFYDNGVYQADATIHELLEILERKGYLRDAVVAITADHGEALGEHGHYVHADNVREASLRIPLLLISFGDRPKRAIDGHAIASQVDIAPTILAELGIPPPATWSGVPLQAPAARDFTYFQERSYIGLVDHRESPPLWKYWIDSTRRQEHVYDLSVDPREEANALAQVPAARLQEWRRRVLAGARVEKGPEAD
jgi:glucan phosphoethanolaminetransferase (alkaline phosphatase superfamily)